MDYDNNNGNNANNGYTPNNNGGYDGYAPNNNYGANNTYAPTPNGQPNYYGNAPQGGPEPGKGMAIASLVLGIFSVLFWFFGYSAILSVLCGIAGLICAGSAKKSGYYGGMRTAGFVLSLIGLIVGALVLIACIACVGILGTAGVAEAVTEYMN